MTNTIETRDPGLLLQTYALQIDNCKYGKTFGHGNCSSGLVLKEGLHAYGGGGRSVLVA